MANAVTSCDLGALDASITAAISAAFPDLQTVEFYRIENRTELPIPACLLEMCEADSFSDPDPGSEQQAMMVRFEARFIMGFKTPAAKLEVRKLAMAFAAFMRQQGRWPGVGGQADVPRLIGCYPDDFEPTLDQFEVWRVEWNQQLWFGNSVWINSGTVPTHVLTGYDPHIGTGHEDDYTELT